MTALAIASARQPSAPQLEIDLGAVAVNTAVLARRSRGDLMAVVKADGFGHGDVAVARTALANGASWLGVTSVTEAIALRDHGLTAPLLSWLNPVDADFEGAIRAGIDLAVPSREHLAAITRAASATGLRARVHLHVDVGMTRDGAPRSGWAGLTRRARDAERAGQLTVNGLMGHLGCADTPGDACNASGMREFEAAARVVRRAGLRPTWRHLAATAATLTIPEAHHDLCRVGAGLVGIDPSGTTKLRGAQTLTAPVVSVRDVGADTPVGYGHTGITTRATRLALLQIGYADGIPRSASNRGSVQLNGRRCRIVGLVSMDQTIVDVGDASVRAGDAAVVFGPDADGEPTIEDWARWAGTIPHEIVTGIGSRVTRVTTGATGTTLRTGR